MQIADVGYISLVRCLWCYSTIRSYITWITLCDFFLQKF